MADTPTELLVEIFNIIHQAELLSDTRSSILTPLTLSHVCRHWREVILDLPHHWTHVHLLSHTRHPSVSQDIFQRSKSYPLSLALAFANSTFTQYLPEPKAFLAVLTDSSVIERLRDLRIIGRNSTLSRITSGFKYFPLLENLVIRQVQPVADQYFVGPFGFNPAVFKSLTLERIGIHCSQSSDLSGITALTLVRAPESILNQTTLLDYNYPESPSTPCMTQLSQLRLIGTSPQSKRKRVVMELFSPSFDWRNLTFVHLSNLEADFPTRIIRSLLNPPSLEELELENISRSALQRLVELVNDISGTPLLPFARVHTLTLANISAFPHALAAYLLRAFPQLRILRLHNVVMEDITATLRDPWVCPMISSLFVNGIEVPRPSAIMMIAPPT